MIPDAQDPFNAKKATVANIWTLGPFAPVTADIIEDPAAELHPGKGIIVLSISEVVPGWKLVLFLDGAVLVEDVRPLLNGLLVCAAQCSRVEGVESA